jgi:hypothetical protein
MGTTADAKGWREQGEEDKEAEETEAKQATLQQIGSQESER